MEITVLTFNIHHGIGTDRKLDLERIARIIEHCQADVVALNEVDKHFSRRSGYVDQLGWLAERLGMNSVFGYAMSSKPARKTSLLHSRQYGNALLSRFPIIGHKNYIFASSALKLEDRALLEASILINGRPIALYVTHLSLIPFVQWKQAHMILQRMKQANLPAILLGDFNAKPHSRLWRKLTKRLTDACYQTSAVPCPTYPSLRPKVQLDYIFVSHHLHIVSAEVIRMMPVASDHLPVKAVLKVQNSIEEANHSEGDRS